MHHCQPAWILNDQNMHAWYIYSCRTPVLFMQAECVIVLFVAEAMHFIACTQSIKKSSINSQITNKKSSINSQITNFVLSLKFLRNSAEHLLGHSYTAKTRGMHMHARVIMYYACMYIGSEYRIAEQSSV